MNAKGKLVHGMYELLDRLKKEAYKKYVGNLRIRIGALDIPIAR